MHPRMVLQYVLFCVYWHQAFNERCQIVTTMIVAYLADKYKHRSGFIAFSVITCMTGICLLAFAEQNSVRYFGMVGHRLLLCRVLRTVAGAFLVNAGNSGCIPTVLTYVSAFGSSYRRPINLILALGRKQCRFS